MGETTDLNWLAGFLNHQQYLSYFTQVAVFFVRKSEWYKLDPPTDQEKWPCYHPGIVRIARQISSTSSLFLYSYDKPPTVGSWLREFSRSRNPKQDFPNSEVYSHTVMQH